MRAATLTDRELRNAFGLFATGVGIATAVNPIDRSPIGVTVNSFNTVSLLPPLVLFSLGRAAWSRPAFEASGAFTVNLLGEHQGELSSRFARASIDKWAGVGHRPGEIGGPILEGALAWFECQTEAVHQGGDHMIFIGRVIHLGTRPGLRPLVFYSGRYQRCVEGLEEDAAGAAPVRLHAVGATGS